MACKRRGKRCLSRIARIAHRMGWQTVFNVERDGNLYAVVIVDNEQRAHAFPGSGKALVFIVREARKLGLPT